MTHRDGDKIKVEVNPKKIVEEFKQLIDLYINCSLS